MIFHRNKEEKIYSPFSGKIINIEEVNDNVFSQKLLGNGIAFTEIGNIVKSPCDGVISMIAKSSHAVGILTTMKNELLIHVGLDTVELNGEGFKPLVSSGQKVKRGDQLLELDLEYLSENCADLTSLIILIGNKGMTKVSTNDIVTQNQAIFIINES